MFKSKQFNPSSSFSLQAQSSYLAFQVVQFDQLEKVFLFIIKFPYNAHFDWLKQRTLSKNKEQVNGIKLAFKFLLRNFDKFDPN